MSDILVISEMPKNYNELFEYIKKSGHKIIIPDNNEHITKLIEEKTIDILLIEFVKVDIDKLYLIEDIKYNHKYKIEIIVISNLINTELNKKLKDLHVSTVLTNPFNKEDLLSLINSFNTNSTKTDEDNIYLKIDTKEYFENQTSKYNIFLKFPSSGKYVKIINKNEILDENKYSKLINNNFDRLYILKKDHQDYLEKSVNNNENKTNHSEDKIRQIKKINELLLEEIYFSEFQPEIYNLSLEVAKKNINLILEDNKLLSVINELEKFSDEMYKHNIGVCILSVMLAKKLGQFNDKQIYDLCIASLYHDVGKKWLDKKILNKKIENLSVEELSLYQMHPQHAYEMLYNVKSINEDILKIILQHHEWFNGGGYPNNLHTPYIHPLASIISITNTYCNLTLKNQNYPLYPHKEAIEIMKKEDIAKYNMTMLETLIVLS